MGIFLTDEEIRRLVTSVAGFEGIEVGAKTQLKKVAGWGSEYCEFQNRPRRECGHCWQALLKEVE